MAGVPHSPLLCSCLRRRIDHSASNLSLSVCTQTHTQTHTRTHTNSHTDTHMHTDTRTHPNTCTHTHRPSLASIPSLSASFCCLKRFIGKQVACRGMGQMCWFRQFIFPTHSFHFKSFLLLSHADILPHTLCAIDNIYPNFFLRKQLRYSAKLMHYTAGEASG